MREFTPNTKAEAPNGYYRRVIRIEAEDSPNVRYARAEIAAGLQPSDRVIVHGVKSWGEYQKNLATWSRQKQEMSLRARFWKGASALMFPYEWLDRAERRAEKLALEGMKRQALGIGVDPATRRYYLTAHFATDFAVPPNVCL